MAYRVAVFILGAVIGAYWLRVLKMARRARKSSGRAANLIPPEPLGRVIRVVWWPVVLVWIAHPFVLALAGHVSNILRPAWRNSVIAWAGVAGSAICFHLSRRCWRAMGRDWRMGIDPNERNPLLHTGPFAIVRHPIYALSQAMMLATLAAIPSPLMLTAALLHVLLLQWESRREERHMMAIHGNAYAEYRKSVGRFLPRIIHRGVITAETQRTQRRRDEPQMNADECR